MVLAPLIGLEPAIKLIVLAIPPLTVAGFLWVAREVHGRIPPTAYFAMPFGYGHPFMFGFVNFALSMALGVPRLRPVAAAGAAGPNWLRARLFVPISLVVFFTHAYGWGVLGLLCFSAEAVRHPRSRRTWFRAGFHAALNASVMALPIADHLAVARGAAAARPRTGSTGSQMAVAQWRLRDRWQWFDIGRR